jgi:hypothetical protein
MTYCDAFDAGPESHPPKLAEGDIVRLGPSGALTLEILAVRGDKAWVRDLDDGRYGVVDLVSFWRFWLDTPGMFQ